MSQTGDDAPGIAAETTRPALEVLEIEAVGSADAEDVRIVPTKRKRAAAVRESGQRRRKEEAADW